MSKGSLSSALRELVELERLAPREGALAPALEARRTELRERVGQRVVRMEIPTRVLVETVREARPWTAALPGVARTGAAWARGPWGARLKIVGAFAICAAFALGPALDVALDTHLLELARGPVPFLFAVWGLAYPALLSRYRRTATLAAAGLPAVEGPIFVSSTLVLAGGLLALRTSISGIWGAGLLAVGLPAVVVATLRETAEIGVRETVAQLAKAAGRDALSALAPIEARRWLELAVTVSPRGRPLGSEDLDGLRVAISMEAELLRSSGRALAGWSLAFLRGVDPDSAESEAALDSWIEHSRVPRPEALEAVGAHRKAARLYRGAGRHADAARCVRAYGERVSDPAGMAWCVRAIAELDHDPPWPWVLRLLGEVEAHGASARESLTALAALPEPILGSEALAEELGRRLEGQPAERGVGVLEAVVGARSPSQLPELFSLLAAAYRRLGHRGTARRIESDLGEIAKKRAESVTVPTPELVEQHTEDLARELQDRYELVGRLGAGAMGKVHLAEDLLLGRKVAIKVLRPQMASSLFVEKFMAEARVVARLDHPGIVRIFDAGQTGPWFYFVMELIEGFDLATVMAHPELPKLAERLRWVAEIAEAMAYAHEHRVIHRDLKPANILVSNRDGRARVTDFGIAHVSSSADATSFSKAGMQVGTPLYMAPEQLAHGVRANPSTDVYALGVSLYFVLTQSLPFRDDDVLRKLEEPAPSLADGGLYASPELEAVVRETLATAPEDRISGMAALARRLRACPDLAGPTRNSGRLRA